jgi:hypothetical protein
MSRLLLVILLLATVLPAQAADHVALDVNFDADPTGDWPDFDLPGDPDGDWFEIGGRFPSDLSTAYVVDSYFDLTSKPLHVIREPGENLWFAFHVDPDLIACDSYTITWSSLMGSNPPLLFVYLTFWGGDQKPKTSVEYRDGGRLTAISSLNVLDATWTTGVSQDFRLEIDMVERKTYLWIDEAPMPSAQGLGFSYGNADSHLELISLNIGYTSEAIFGFDDLQVVAHCDEVANENVSWGHLKSMYRDEAPAE